MPERLWSDSENEHRRSMGISWEEVRTSRKRAKVAAGGSVFAVRARVDLPRLLAHVDCALHHGGAATDPLYYGP